MKINGFIWLNQFVEKLEIKHGVLIEEVEDLFRNRPQIRKAGRGKVRGENLYRALGQTSDDRLLTVIFIYKPSQHRILVVSARDMDNKERKQYGR